jgi:hypothetical protein
MLKWVGKLLGGTSIDAPDDIPVAWIKQLEKVLEPVGKCSASAPEQMLAFVCVGEPTGVLHTVAKQEEYCKALGLLGWLPRDGQPKKLYDDVSGVPARVGLRWAKLLEAACTSQQTRYHLGFVDGQHWPEVLLMHASGRAFNVYGGDDTPAAGLTTAWFEQLLIEDGLAPQALLTAGFAINPKQGYGSSDNALRIARVSGYSAYLHKHVESVRPLLGASDVQQRLHMLKMLAGADAATLTTLAPELVEMACSSSKQVRAAADVLVRKAPAESAQALKSVARQGKPDQRLNALRLLWDLSRGDSDDALRNFARETAQADNAPSIQALISEWDGPEGAPTAPTRYDYELPTITWSGALTDEAARALDALWVELDAGVVTANKEGREHERRSQNSSYKHKHKEIAAFTDAERRRLREHIAEPTPTKANDKERINIRRIGWYQPVKILEKFAAMPGVTPVVLIKALDIFGELESQNGRVAGRMSTVVNAMHRATGRPTLLELQYLLQPFGISPEIVLFEYCNGWNSNLAKDWSAEAQWPFFAHHLELLLRYMNPTLTRENYWFDRGSLFRAIATLPAPPDALVNVLFDLALGTSKTERAPAQAALANLPGKKLRIINALADGKSEVRMLAALWLMRLQHQPGQAAIEKALAKEKNDVAKGAMLDALESFGQPVEKYLDRTALAKEAVKSLAKGIPADLAWFPFDAMPRVRWADQQVEIEADVLRWLIVQAVKQKSPEPNAVLRKYCQMFEPRDREALGQFVLEAWLREDVKPISADEAMQRARNSAQSTHASMQQYPQYYKDSPMLGRSVDELYAQFLPSYMRQPAGSAASSKGVLAVAAACARERAATSVSRYLKEYYGTRASQGKSLIAMLAWIDHPSATQLMLSIGNRFRTRSFQEEAMRQAEALAERRGWTVAELADRTIPSAGFDDTGTLELNFGSRVFTARLLPDFKIELLNPDGKKIAALPEPRMDDDAELAKDAKKAFSAAKKEVKGIVEQQTDRLYEALCTERDWRFEDWALYLNQHPIMRRLIQRLVWAEMADGQVKRTFRPLDDGTLTDRDDNEVQLEPDARVRIAHDSILPEGEVAQWQQHLADYEIAPLFQQLGKGVYQLPEAKAKEDTVTGFEGHLLEAFALRGRALKLGYTRGAAQDGGWFMTYEKRFPTLGLEATIEFTGNPLPEENRTVALLHLSFARLQTERQDAARLKLDEVPKVLLSECYNDLRLLAAEGTGYDAEWRKKSEY